MTPLTRSISIGTVRRYVRQSDKYTYDEIVNRLVRAGWSVASTVEQDPPRSRIHHYVCTSPDGLHEWRHAVRSDEPSAALYNYFF